jgi:hypothetical protein
MKAYCIVTAREDGDPNLKKNICTFNGAHDTKGVTKKFKVDGLAMVVIV